MTQNTAPATGWSFLGQVVRPAKPLWVLLAVSLVVAFETFLERQPPYPLYMSVAVLAVAAWLVVRAWFAKSLLGVAGVLFVAPWLGQLLGAGWMDNSVLVFFLSHSIYAVWVAVAAYTFMARRAPS